jgi:hypothetical protein
MTSKSQYTDGQRFDGEPPQLSEADKELFQVLGPFTQLETSDAGGAGAPTRSGVYGLYWTLKAKHLEKPKLSHSSSVSLWEWTWKTETKLSQPALEGKSQDAEGRFAVVGPFIESIGRPHWRVQPKAAAAPIDASYEKVLAKHAAEQTLVESKPVIPDELTHKFKAEGPFWIVTSTH